MSGRDLGHFNCGGRYLLPAHFSEPDFVEFVMDGVKDVQFPETRTYTGQPPEPGFPAQPPNLGVASARDVLREQSELIAKYAAHCERKVQVCSNVATLLEYTARAKLARDMSLIYFRAATLED